jgi:hypothetical protein
MISPNVFQAGVGRSGVIAVDPMTNPFNIGIEATLASAATFNVEYSLDDPMAAGYTPAGAVWYVASGFSGVSASTSGAFTVPCRAISLNVTSGTGTVQLMALQAGLR